MFNEAKRIFLKQLLVLTAASIIHKINAPLALELDSNQKEKPTAREVQDALEKYDTLLKESELHQLDKKYKQLYGEKYFLLCPEIFWMDPIFQIRMNLLKKAGAESLETERIWSLLQTSESFQKLLKVGVLQSAPTYNVVPRYEVQSELERKEDFENLTKKVATTLRSVGFTKLPWRIEIVIVPFDTFPSTKSANYIRNTIFRVENGILIGKIQLPDDLSTSFEKSTRLLQVVMHEFMHSIDLQFNPILLRFFSPTQICELLSLRSDSVIAGRVNHYPVTDNILSNNFFFYPKYIFTTMGKYVANKRESYIDLDLQTKIGVAAFYAFPPQLITEEDSLQQILIRKKVEHQNLQQKDSMWAYFFSRLQSHQELVSLEVLFLLDYFQIEHKANNNLAQLFSYLLLYFLMIDVHEHTLPLGILTTQEQESLDLKTNKLLQIADLELLAKQAEFDVVNTLGTTPTGKSNTPILQYIQNFRRACSTS